MCVRACVGGGTGTQVRRIESALKEGMRESPGQLSGMGPAAYRRLLEDQIAASRQSRAKEQADLNATLWWEKAERRKRREEAQQQADGQQQDEHGQQLDHGQQQHGQY